jgi:lysophospholipase L1-like esterase
LEEGKPSGVFRAKQSVADHLKVMLVDCTEVIKTKGKRLYLEGDTVHLTAEGNELVAKRLAESLKELIL